MAVLRLVGGKLEVNEEEAEAIRVIFQQYATTDAGANGIAKYLENHGIHGEWDAGVCRCRRTGAAGQPLENRRADHRAEREHD